MENATGQYPSRFVSANDGSVVHIMRTLQWRERFLKGTVNSGRKVEEYRRISCDVEIRHLVKKCFSC